MNEYLDRQLKLREKNLKYDFLPSMLELIERPANRAAELILFFIIALIVTAFVWAAFFKIDIAVTAVGAVMPEGGVIPLDFACTGMVSEVYVKDGAFVSEGDIILSLDSTAANLAVSECRYNMEVLSVQRELYGKIYEDLCAESGTDIEVTDAFDTSVYGVYASIADAILLENTLYKKELDLLADDRERENALEQYKLNVFQNMNTLDIKINDADTALKNAENELERYDIKAPADGQITQISVTNKGVFVSSGETAAYLVPEENEKLFTAYVSDEDIARIHAGDTVRVKIAAYDDTEYEYMEGTVLTVGTLGVKADGIGTAYTVSIRLAHVPDDMKTGMEGRCDIIIGTRTVLDYFLEPFRKGFSDSLKER